MASVRARSGLSGGSRPAGGGQESELSQLSQMGDFPQPEVEGWRRLPTAWIHLFWVESFHIYTAIFAWMHLVDGINVGTAIPGYSVLGGRLNEYFHALYFYGSTTAVSVHLHNVTDTFFLDENSNETVTYGCSSMNLPATTIAGQNILWLLIAWTLPIGAVVLVAYLICSFYPTGIWSFESLAYLRFTWMLYRKPGFRYCVAVMAVGPVILPIVWVVQIIVYDLQDQWLVVKDSTLSGLLLLFSLDFLAFPTTPVHEWPRRDERLAGIRFRRSLLHLFLGGNNNFGMKLMDALWTAQHGDLSRLQRYLADPEQAGAVLELCRMEQQAEADKKRSRAAEGRSADTPLTWPPL